MSTNLQAVYVCARRHHPSLRIPTGPRCSVRSHGLILTSHQNLHHTACEIENPQVNGLLLRQVITDRRLGVEGVRDIGPQPDPGREDIWQRHFNWRVAAEPMSAHARAVRVEFGQAGRVRSESEVAALRIAETGIQTDIAVLAQESRNGTDPIATVIAMDIGADDAGVARVIHIEPNATGTRSHDAGCERDVRTAVRGNVAAMGSRVTVECALYQCSPGLSGPEATAVIIGGIADKGAACHRSCGTIAAAD